MSDEALCFRTFAECIRPQMKEKTIKKKYDTDKTSFSGKTMPIKGTGVFQFYTLLLESIVYLHIENDNSQLPDISGSMTSQIKNGKAEAPEKICELAQRDNSVSTVALYFAANLIPNIPKKTLDDILGKIDDLIKNDKTLDKKTSQKLTKMKDKLLPADYLAEVFISAVLRKANIITVQKTVRKETKRDTTSITPHAIWSASQSCFMQSHEEGNRFHALDIIDYLLPKGYPVSHKNFHLKGQLEDGELTDITRLCKNTNHNITIIGVGGIGKTTFLQQIMASAYWKDSDTIKKEKADYTSKHADPIPIFIELNRCPADIGCWYDNSLRKTNFITRYVGQMIENHTSLSKVSIKTLDQLEKNFQKVPRKGSPEYLLLLDGFNEVSTKNAAGSTMSIRAMLSNEIARLNEYPNIRIITTSRETQSAHFADKFENIYLQGITETDIIEHLKNSGFTETEIGLARSRESLWECLRIPLFLCIFSLEQGKDYLPETQGEILYAFFHKDSAFYNTRQRYEETGADHLGMPQVAVILDFILPYIGWHFAESDLFSVSAAEFADAIETGIKNIEDIFLLPGCNPYADFSYQQESLKDAYLGLFDSEGSLRAIDIITCIHGFLGICYSYTENKGNFASRNRYSFIHHYFRDYFSAIYEVMVLKLLSCINIESLQTSGKELAGLLCFLDHGHWHSNKIELISQILMEHLNKPRLSELDGNWFLPEHEQDEQSVLTNTISFCRHSTNNGMDIHYLLSNTLSAILHGRKELSGIDLSGLDLKHCNFFNTQCSKRGKSQYLAVNFNDSHLYMDNFNPVEHVDSIIEYIYSGSKCFTIDLTGVIKCWDILSGKQEYMLQSDDPMGMQHFSSKNYMLITGEQGWLIAKVQSHNGLESAYLNLFDLQSPEELPRVWRPERSMKQFNYLGLTGDKQYIICIGCNKDIYIISIKDAKTKLQYTDNNLFNHTELYTRSFDGPYYVFTSEYHEYDFEELNEISVDDEVDDESDVDEADDYEEDAEENENEDWEEDTIPCIILCYHSSFTDCTPLYSYSCEAGAEPTVGYFPDENCFLIYNETIQGIERISCKDGKAYPILSYFSGKQPMFIYPHPQNRNEGYLMYGDVCYHVDISVNNTKNGGTITKYPASTLKKILRIPSAELTFRVGTVPASNRLMVSDEVKTYEWELVNDNVRLRYNMASYDNCDAIKDTSHGLFILIHSYNGVTVLAEEPFSLVHSYCFPYDGYYIAASAYHENTQQLSLLFSKPGHDFVLLLSFEDNHTKTIFSTLNLSDTIEMIVFKENGEAILITTNNKVWEYALGTDEIFLVREVGDNEVFVGGGYREDDIEIAVAMRFADKTPEVAPRMDYCKVEYQGSMPVYIKKGYCEIPYLSENLLGSFIHKNHDLGRECCFDSKGMQKYWITQGFFKDHTEDITAFLSLDYYDCLADHKKPCRKIHKPLQMLYVFHDKSLDTPYRIGTNVNAYSYLADDFSSALLIHDYELLLHYPDLLTKPDLCYTYDYREANKVGGNVYWDSALPFNNGTSLLCCYEGFHVMEVDIRTNETKELDYAPGVAICGCSFENARFDSEEVEQKVLAMVGKM